MIPTTFRKFRLPKIFDERGNLSVFENDGYFPFGIQWVSWFHSGEETHYDTRLASQDQVIIVLSGALKLIVKTGLMEEELLLDDACNCIHLPNSTTSRISWSSAGTCAFIAGNTTSEASHLPKDLLTNNLVAHEQYELLGQ